MATRVEMIIETLQANPGTQFTARELAQAFIARYPLDIAEKRLNPRYNTEAKLITQLAAEVGGERTTEAKKRCPNIATHDKPRPRRYYWDASATASAGTSAAVLKPVSTGYSESDLYPLLMDYLSQAMGLLCVRIDERKSSNNNGSGGNHWLHPDIVCMEPLARDWDSVVSACARSSNNSLTRLWSFEVKKQLTRSNVRKCFFQTVSNSSWANYGYLVATGMNDDVEAELQMLAALHGIGVLILDTESLYDSQIIIPARERGSVDWQSVNRLAQENPDFMQYIAQVDAYNHRPLEIPKWHEPSAP